MSVIPTHGRWKQEGHEFKASLGYIARFYLKKISKNKINETEHRWLTPVIPATQEADIRRIAN
jgi:hypothetical protein